MAFRKKWILQKVSLLSFFLSLPLSFFCFLLSHLLSTEYDLKDPSLLHSITKDDLVSILLDLKFVLFCIYVVLIFCFILFCIYPASKKNSDDFFPLFPPPFPLFPPQQKIRTKRDFLEKMLSCRQYWIPPSELFAFCVRYALLPEQVNCGFFSTKTLSISHCFFPSSPLFLSRIQTQCSACCVRGLKFVPVIFTRLK